MDRSEIQTGTKGGICSQKAQQADHNGTGPTGKVKKSHRNEQLRVNQ